MGARMLVSLATNGDADAYAIDRLILGFEAQYSTNEKDANLWRAYVRRLNTIQPPDHPTPTHHPTTSPPRHPTQPRYFRANAEFITRYDLSLLSTIK